MFGKTALRVACLALLGFVTTAAQAQNAVYIPNESKHPQDQTWVFLTNTDTKTQTVTLRFIHPHVDGTANPDDTMEVKVPAGQTKVVRDAAPIEGVGLIEVLSAGPVEVTANLGKVGGLIRDVPTERVPVISARNSGAGGTSLDLTGLQRELSGATVTDVRLVNLSHDEGSCRASVFRADGAQLWGTFKFEGLAPLSVFPFDDVLMALNEVEGANIRIRFTCDDTFYAYATLVDPDEQRLVFAPPSPSVQDFGLAVPSDDGGNGGNSSCAAGSLCFEYPGVAHKPTKGNTTRSFHLPIPAGIYKSVRLTFDLKNAGWSPKGSSLSYGLFWLVKNFKNPDMFGYAFVEGPNRNTVILRHGFDQDQGAKAKIIGGLQWPEGQTLRVEYLFDTENDFIELLIKDTSGNVLERLTGKPNVRKIHYDNAGELSLDVGNRNINPKEPTQTNWEWRNILIEVVPE